MAARSPQGGLRIVPAHWLEGGAGRQEHSMSNLHQETYGYNLLQCMDIWQETVSRTSLTFARRFAILDAVAWLQVL